MSGFLQLLLIVSGFLGVCYLVLAIALGFREKRHGSCCCSSSPDGKGKPDGSCCKDVRKNPSA